MENVSLKIERFTFDIIYYVLWIVQITLLLRFTLKLLGANANNEIIAFIYSASWALMGPFKDVFGTAAINNMVLEPSVLIAMVFYAIVAYIGISLLKIVTQNSRYTPPPTHLS